MTREQELVQLLRTDQCLAAMKELVGGATATGLRSARVSPRALDALVEGLQDANPRTRWWCVQLLDHMPEPRAIAAIASLLDDPVARVRRNAAHALGCVTCKPSWPGGLPEHVVRKLGSLAESDPSPKVRAEAASALACRRAAAQESASASASKR